MYESFAAAVLFNKYFFHAVIYNFSGHFGDQIPASSLFHVKILTAESTVFHCLVHDAHFLIICSVNIVSLSVCSCVLNHLSTCALEFLQFCFIVSLDCNILALFHVLFFACMILFHAFSSICLNQAFLHYLRVIQPFQLMIKEENNHKVKKILCGSICNFIFDIKNKCWNSVEANSI